MSFAAWERRSSSAPPPEAPAPDPVTAPSTVSSPVRRWRPWWASPTIWAEGSCATPWEARPSAGPGSRSGQHRARHVSERRPGPDSDDGREGDLLRSHPAGVRLPSGERAGPRQRTGSGAIFAPPGQHQQGVGRGRKGCGGHRRGRLEAPGQRRRAAVHG